jgi:hypothetical protein
LLPPSSQGRSLRLVWSCCAEMHVPFSTAHERRAGAPWCLASPAGLARSCFAVGPARTRVLAAGAVVAGSGLRRPASVPAAAESHRPRRGSRTKRSSSR